MYSALDRVDSFSSCHLKFMYQASSVEPNDKFCKIFPFIKSIHFNIVYLLKASVPCSLLLIHPNNASKEKDSRKRQGHNATV